MTASFLPLPGRPATPPRWLALAVPAALVAGAVAVFLALGAGGAYSLTVIYDYLPTAAGPAVTALEVTTLSFGIGFFLALPLASIRAHPPHRAPAPLVRPAGSATPRFPASRAPADPDALRSRARRTAEALVGGLRWPAYAFASGYVAAVRGTPALVQVFLTFYAIIFTVPRLEFLGVGAPFWAGLIALTINTTAYQSEALRAGLQSVAASQIEAATALGLDRRQVFGKVVLPQALRLVTLPLTNEWISNFKTSAILEYIAVVELFYWARTDIAYGISRPAEAFVMLAIIYLVINVTLSRAVAFVERRRRIRGLGRDVGSPPDAPPPGGVGRPA